MAHRRHRLSFCCRYVFRRAAEYCARFDLFGFLGGSAHRVHGLRRNRPPPQPPEMGQQEQAESEQQRAQRQKDSGTKP